jgi:hypothetical protein
MPVRLRIDRIRKLASETMSGAVRLPLAASEPLRTKFAIIASAAPCGSRPHQAWSLPRGTSVPSDWQAT